MPRHRVLLTGGTGFVGRTLAAALLRAGHEVQILTRSTPSAADPLLAQGARVVVGDLCRPESVAGALEEVDTVYHLAAALDPRDAKQLHRVNVEASVTLARAVRERRIERLIHLSSAGVYGERPGRTPHVETDAPAPRSPYELTKHQGEQAVRHILEEGATSWVVCRPTGVFGGHRRATQAFLRQVLTRRLWVHAPPRVIVHPTYIDDLVQALTVLLDRPHVAAEILNIGGDRALMFDEWVSLAACALGTHARQIVVASTWLAAAARMAGAAIRAGHGTVPRRLASAGQVFASRAVDFTKAARLIDYVPTPIGIALDQTVATARALGVV